MARTPLMAGNWKMHKDHLEAIQLVQQLVYHLEYQDYERTEIVVIPPLTALRSIQTLIDGDRLQIGLGAQNCHWETAGAYTGEVSPAMLAKLAVRYVICGHSERRQLFGETDEQREAGEAEHIVSEQLEASLDGIARAQATEVVVAYEPVWAIGTGKTATPSDANTMCGHVRAQLAKHFDAETARQMRVQYGGSVKAGNVAQLMRQRELDGALVGGASLQADNFAAICRYHRL